jgi:hypothetical protein
MGTPIYRGWPSSNKSCEFVPNSSTPEVTPILAEIKIISIIFGLLKIENG